MQWEQREEQQDDESRAQRDGPPKAGNCAGGFHGCSFRFHFIRQFQALETSALLFSNGWKKLARSFPDLGTSGKARLVCGAFKVASRGAVESVCFMV
jgi:hypothetical protein